VPPQSRDVVADPLVKRSQRLGLRMTLSVALTRSTFRRRSCRGQAGPCRTQTQPHREHHSRSTRTAISSRPIASRPGSSRSRAGRLNSMETHRASVTDFVHIGLVVEDLDETVRFLALLGFDCSKPAVLSGEWIGRIIGLENVTVEVVMARAPDGSDMFEVVRFLAPSAGAQELPPTANRPGLRHVAFKVDDLHGVVERVREGGWETVGEIVDFESTFLLCYVRGLKA
jgi:catechol 2,3-dioxygenase-like lactoylglutathione lyase family enzyme